MAVKSVSHDCLLISAFKIKKTTPISKVMDAYCNKLGVPSTAYRFYLDDNRLNGHETPESLELEDGDIISAMAHQVGGY
jgi:small ubiquitin-related modifier